MKRYGILGAALLVPLAIAFPHLCHATTPVSLPPPQIESSASGTGFVVHEDGYILTNEHVVRGSTSIAVWVAGDRYDAELVVADEESDIALLKVNAHDLSMIPLADSDSLVRGDTVYAVGCPRGICGTITQGRVANLGVKIGSLGMIMMDLTITHGSSGGPLVDRYGRVVGITTAGLKADEEQTSGFSLAVPINEAQSLLARIPDVPATSPPAEPLDFTDIARLVEPGTAYVETRIGKTIVLHSEYGPPSKDADSLLPKVLEAYPDHVAGGIEGNWELDRWESQVEYDETVKTIHGSWATSTTSVDIRHREAAAAVVIQAPSSDRAAALLSDLMNRPDLLLGFGEMSSTQRAVTLDSSTRVTGGLRVSKKILFRESQELVPFGPGAIFYTGGYIDVVIGMQVGTLVVYAHVQYSASHNDSPAFGITEGRLILHVDDSMDGAGNLDVGLDVDQFVDRAYAEIDSFFASILEQLP
jgi:hypothetical protein